MGELVSGGTCTHGIQDEGLTYTRTIISDQNRVKQAATRDHVAATGTTTGCPSLLQDVLIFCRKFAESFRRERIMK